MQQAAQLQQGHVAPRNPGKIENFFFFVLFFTRQKKVVGGKE